MRSSGARTKKVQLHVLLIWLRFLVFSMVARALCSKTCGSAAVMCSKACGSVVIYAERRVARVAEDRFLDVEKKQRNKLSTVIGWK